MTTATTDLPTGSAAANRAPAPGRRLSQRVESYLRRLSRADLIEALNARSDAELRALGLTRGDIPRHAFRGLTHL